MFSFCVLTSPSTSCMISRSPLSGPFVHVRLSVHMYMISSDIVVPFASLPHSPTEPTRSLSFQCIERSLALLQRCPDSVPGHAISRLLPAPPYAPGSNASGHAAAAFSAPQADPMPAVPSAMGGAAPFVRACQRPRLDLPRIRVGIPNHASKPERVGGHRCVGY